MGIPWGNAVLAKYGPGYFAELRKRRKTYPKQGDESPVIQPNWRSMAGSRNGQKGGMARAERYSPEHLREWGRLGGIETLVRHGKQFYREIRKRRKHYKKGYFTRKTKMRLRKKCEREARKSPSAAIAAMWRATAMSFDT